MRTMTEQPNQPVESNPAAPEPEESPKQDSPEQDGPEQDSSPTGEQKPPAEDSAVKAVGKKIVAHPVGKLGAVIFGAMIGLAVETGVDATGILGPGVDQLIAEQSAGFHNLEAKLEALRNTTDPEEAKKLTVELETLLTRQQQLGQRTETELRVARAEIEKLRTEVLESKGATTGADTWLLPGESITVAGRAGNNFGFNNFTFSGHTKDITVNVNGEKDRMEVGDAAEFPADKGVWKVIYKVAEKRSDGRVGFDIVFVPAE